MSLGIRVLGAGGVRSGTIHIHIFSICCLGMRSAHPMGSGLLQDIDVDWATALIGLLRVHSVGQFLRLSDNKNTKRSGLTRVKGCIRGFRNVGTTFYEGRGAIALKQFILPAIMGEH